MKLKIFIIFISFLAISVFTYFFYPIIKNRYFEKNQKSSENNIEIENKSGKNSESENNLSEFSDSEQETANAKTENISVDISKVDSDENENILAHITTEHCDNECKSFATDLKLFEYCEQVCGISPEKKVSDCNSKKNIQKDYCLKDLAITKNDASICNDIDDLNIKRTCKNRLMEDILESQQSSQALQTL